MSIMMEQHSTEAMQSCYVPCGLGPSLQLRWIHVLALSLSPCGKQEWAGRHWVVYPGRRNKFQTDVSVKELHFYLGLLRLEDITLESRYYSRTDIMLNGHLHGDYKFARRRVELCLCAALPYVVHPEQRLGCWVDSRGYQ